MESQAEESAVGGREKGLLTDPVVGLASAYQAYISAPNRSASSFLQSLMDGSPNFWMCEGRADGPRPGEPGPGEPAPGEPAPQTHLDQARLGGTSFVDAMRRAIPVVALNGVVNPRELISSVETLAASNAALAVSLAYQLLGVAAALERHGGGKHADVCAKLTRGEALAALAMTEPASGSDAAAMTTIVARDGGRATISGLKTLVTNGSFADLFLVAVADTSGGHDCTSVFLVPADRPGVIRRALDIRGDRPFAASGMAEIAFQNVEVSDDDLVGETGDGYAVTETALGLLRLGVASIAIGLARSELLKARLWVTGRTQFGKSLVENADVRERLAVSAETLASGEAILRLASGLAVSGRDFSGEAAVAKVFCTEGAAHVLDECARLRGGAGYLDDSLSDALDTARALHFVAGANEVIRLFIAAYGGRFTTQFALDADGGGKGAAARFAGLTMKARRGLRMGVKLPGLPAAYSEAAGVFKEMVTILGERSYQVLSFLKNDALFHAYEMRRLADMAIEALVLWAVLRGNPKCENAPYVTLRAGRSWSRFIRFSRELFLSDEQAVEGVISLESTVTEPIAEKGA